MMVEMNSGLLGTLRETREEERDWIGLQLGRQALCLEVPVF
jgi:hypothetical protein